MTGETPRIGERANKLDTALRGAKDPRDVVIGLPDEVIGRVAFTVVASGAAGEPLAWDVVFDWDGSSEHSPLWLEISGMEAISPASSAPIEGWVSWRSLAALTIAFEDNELETHGVVWNASGSPRPGVSAEEWEPADWAEMARRVIDSVNGALAESDPNSRVFRDA